MWLRFDPHAGHEQTGRWPAFVVSPRSYRSYTWRVGLALFCPLTSRVKGHPCEVLNVSDIQQSCVWFEAALQRFGDTGRPGTPAPAAVFDIKGHTETG